MRACGIRRNASARRSTNTALLLGRQGRQCRNGNFQECKGSRRQSHLSLHILGLLFFRGDCLWNISSLIGELGLSLCLKICLSIAIVN